MHLNGRSVELRAAPTTPLLWVIRGEAELPGTKYGCGVGVCGVCTVHLDGKAVKACQVTLAESDGRSVTTIEGLAEQGHRAIAAWIDEQVPQCGYCQPAMVMAAAAAVTPGAGSSATARAMSEVLCRCGSYTRVRRALARLAVTQAPRAGAAPKAVATPGPAHVLNPWVAIAEDGTVIVRIDRAEMGQGALTGLAMLVAEELEADWSTVRTEFAPVDSAYANPMFGEQSTGGSTSIRSSYEPLRRAGAAAREMLVAAAAWQWKVTLNECRAEQGAVRHLPSNKVVGFGALAEAAARLNAPAAPTLKAPSAFRLIGKPTHRIEVPGHVRGETRFGIDVRMPKQVYAVLRRPPHSDAVLLSEDRKAASATPGVLQVRDVAAGIAVIAETPWAALAGREALKAQWKLDGMADSAAIARTLAVGLATPGRIARKAGDVDTVLRRAAAVVDATYATPFQAHAPMEPMNCTVHIDGKRADVWVGTQSLADVRAVVAEAAGFPVRAVTAHAMFLGGSFGRRMESDFVAEAAQIARLVDRPVQLLWSRDDDMRHGSFRPANRASLRGSLDAGGQIEALAMKFAGPGMSLDGVNMLYAIPNTREEQVRVELPVALSAWRAVGASQNGFIVEGFIDELAHAAGADPLAFRLAHLAGQPRLAGVLQRVATEARWHEPLGPGRGRGIAAYRSFGSYVAVVAEVTARPAGVPRVDRIVMAADCGVIVNPDAVAAQMEGAAIFALGATLLSEITFRNGAVVESSFADYPIVRYAEAPLVEVHLVASDEAPGGAGEPGVPPLAPAVVNAIFAATGKRVRALPVRMGG